jgi:hypothetical protein
MNKLSKEKRDQLILVALITLGVLAGLWLGVINFQKQSLKRLSENKSKTEQKLQDMQQAIKSAGKVQALVTDAAAQLHEQEQSMASGDLYFWMTETIRNLKVGHKVEIPSLSGLEGPKEFNMIPKFPYQQAAVSMLGTAYFHDLGRFIRDLENQFPLIRVQNLDIEPAPALAGAEGAEKDNKEKLTFRMDLVALVKPAGQ